MGVGWEVNERRKDTNHPAYASVTCPFTLPFPFPLPFPYRSLTLRSLYPAIPSGREPKVTGVSE